MNRIIFFLIISFSILANDLNSFYKGYTQELYRSGIKYIKIDGNINEEELIKLEEFLIKNKINVLSREYEKNVSLILEQKDEKFESNKIRIGQFKQTNIVLNYKEEFIKEYFLKVNTKTIKKVTLSTENIMTTEKILVRSYEEVLGIEDKWGFVIVVMSIICFVFWLVNWLVIGWRRGIVFLTGIIFLFLWITYKILIKKFI